jgi:hypothetical protein
MMNNDHLLVAVSVQERQQRFIQEAAMDQQIQGIQSAWHKWMAARLGDALIAGGERLKSLEEPYPAYTKAETVS